MKRTLKYIHNILLWPLFSIPVVTLGASTTAMHFVNFKLVQDDSINVNHEFIKSFKQNFLQSIPILIISAVAGYFIVKTWVAQLSDFENMNMLIFGLLIIATFIFCGFETMSTYLLAKFDNSTKRLMMLTVYSMLRHTDILTKVTLIEMSSVLVPGIIIAVNPGAVTFIVGAVLFLCLLLVHEIVSSKQIVRIYDILLSAQEEAMRMAKEKEESEETVSETEDESKDDQQPTA